MMVLGPEFRRNIWIRFSWFSLAVMPVLIGLGVLGTWLSQRAADELGEGFLGYRGLYVLDPHWSAAMVFPALTFFFLVAIILGTYEAAAAFTDEQKNKTWDLQKTSAIRPSHIVLGKLLGAPSYAWYFSFGLLAVFVYAYSNYAADVTMNRGPQQMGPVHVKLIYPAYEEIAIVCAYMVLAAFFGHAVALLGSLHNISSRKAAVFGSFIAGLLAAGTIFKIAVAKMTTLFAKPWQYVPGRAELDPPMISWFSEEIPVDTFILASIGYFLFWLVVALYRYTRTELQFRNYPFVWLVFLVTLCVYMAGISYHEEIPALPYMPCFIVMFVLTYYGLFQNADNLSGYRRFFAAARDRDRVKFLEAFPRWLVSAFVLLVVTGGLFYAMGKGLIGPQYKAKDLEEFVTMRNHAYVFVLAMWLFMIRDAIVMHMFLLGERFKHGGFNIVVYYLLAYALIPLLFAGRSTWQNYFRDVFAKNRDPDPVWSFFYPPITDDFVIGLLPVLNEIAVALIAFWWVTHRFRKIETTPAKA